MKSYKKYKGIILGLTMVGAICVLPTLATATVTGQCSNCHTMHNSQDDGYMASTGTFELASSADYDPDDATANSSLLKFGCIGCHTGTNSGGTVPFVLSTSEPTYGGNTLAGGNFYWVNAGSKPKGHNVKDLDAVADMGAPGGTMLVSTLTCAGTNGCHGDPNQSDAFKSIAGGHHGTSGTVLVDPSKTYTDGDATDMSNAFRMLSGIKGIEDKDWEYTTGANDHNMYFGVDRSLDTDEATGSISQLCANCHGDFHNGEVAGNVSVGMSSPWVRHPTDFDMGKLADTTEYAGYSSYSVVAPVASKNLAADYAINDALHKGGLGASKTGDAIVTCLSCHRAHGSPYDDLLRWAYDGVDMTHKSAPADADNNVGCFICHTTKDDA